MPPPLTAVHGSGHDLTSLSCLWEYCGTKLALVMPCAVVLSGWRAFPWGQLGQGPVSPDLKPIVVSGIAIETLEEFADILFTLKKNESSPPMFRQGGSLRPMMHTVLATLIMYYEARFNAKPMEMALVLESMRDSVRDALNDPTFVPHDTLVHWGKLIKTQFTLNNLHLTGSLDRSGVEQIVAAIESLGYNMSRMHLSLSGVKTHLTEMAADLLHRILPFSRSATPITSPENKGAFPPPPAPEVEEASSPSTPFPSTPTPLTSTPNESTPGSKYDMTAANGGASDFYLHCMREQGGDLPDLSSQYASLGKLVKSW